MRVVGSTITARLAIWRHSHLIAEPAEGLKPARAPWLAIGSMAGPYFAILGYDNLAWEYVWPNLGGFWLGSL